MLSVIAVWSHTSYIWKHKCSIFQEGKVASKKRSRTIFILRHTFFHIRGYSSVIWLQDASPSEQLRCGCTHPRHSRLDNFSLRNTTDVTFTFNLSYLKHCWYEVHSAQHHLVSVSALESKQDKDSRSTVQSTSGKGKDKANPSWIHLTKEQRLTTLRHWVASITKSWRQGSSRQFQS